MKKCLSTLFLFLATPMGFGKDFDSKSATVSMEVALYASLTGLDTFHLATPDTNGNQHAVYVGFEQYQLESNGQVRVTLAGSNLSVGKRTVITKYDLDGLGLTYITEPNQAHLADHSVSASAVLGKGDSQKTGDYSGTMVVTVSGI